MKKIKKEQVVDSPIDAVIAELQSKYGEGVVLEDADAPSNVKAISTGCYGLDSVFGCGGLPQGRLIEVYGQESSGKTTMTLFCAGQLQKQGKKVAFLDVEQAYDKKWAESLGVSTKDLIVAQPSTLEETMDILRSFVKTNFFDLIIIDSLAAMVPKKELEEGALEKDTIGLKARAMSRYLSVITTESSKSKTIVIFINQLRANIGVMYGPKDTTPGGKALKYFASVRLSVSKGEAIKEGPVQIGNTVKIVAKKNKVGFPFKETELDLYYTSGIDLYKDTLDAAVAHEIIIKAGNTYEYNGTKIGVGKEQAKHFFRENQEVYAKIRTEIEAKLLNEEAK